VPRNLSSARTHLSTRTRTATLLVAAVPVALAAGALFAGPAGAAAGGSTYVPRPEVKRVKCVASCASKRRARAGQSQLRITGHALSGVRTVVFHGGPGAGDDVRVKAGRRNSRAVRVDVPMEASSGPVSVRVSRRIRSKRSRRIRILPAPAPLPNVRLSLARGPRDPGAPRIETGTSKTRHFYGSRRGIAFSYRLLGSKPAQVRVAVVRASNGQAVRTWPAKTVTPGTVQRVSWRGTSGGRVQRSGRYLYRVVANAPSGAKASNASVHNVRRDAFNLYGHIFPIRGRHSYGGPAARFGDDRGDHIHNGQDTFASCGTKIVAARGGRVRYSGYQGAAGNYIVIDGARNKLDYVYMHMVRRSPFSTGDHVNTGEKIGLVGETGNAQGCHVHFELWRGGWYSGGRAFDPLPSLKAWDRVS
jgi:peptidase M23-like protein